VTDINIETEQQAIAILRDNRYGEFERERAIRFLQEHPSDEGIKAMVRGLEDDDYGVHWACGTAIAYLGENAFPAYLEALSKPDHSARLRDSARHIVHYNSSPRVKDDSQALLAAVKGPSPAITTIEAAYKLREQYN
jgi:HEAT repeat protein